mmetsp:Transcript_54010/g.45412  ORF Transcript_54010/g.45412 Transcript_54010/m.45412 type:complete len:215 (-) Transcript_54010:262-906(-)
MFGSAHPDVYRSLSESIGHIPGYLLPKEHLCPADFLQGIIRGIQDVIVKGKEAQVTHPKNKWFVGNILYPVVSRHKSVLSRLPQRWHRVGDLKGNLILEDIEFIYTVFATVEPQAFKAFENEQWNKFKQEQESKDPNYISIPKILQEKMKLQQRTFYLKGKMGEIIANREKTDRIKRKREELLRTELTQKDIDDQVYLPPDNDFDCVQPPVDKK